MTYFYSFPVKEAKWNELSKFSNAKPRLLQSSSIKLKSTNQPSGYKLLDFEPLNYFLSIFGRIFLLSGL